MPRKLSSWVQAFEKYMAPMGSPKLFGRWTGIFTVAAAMERKNFVDTPKGRLYPSLYVVLVGPAGAGKTVALSVAHDLMTNLEDHHIAPTSLTKAAMIDTLEAANRHIIRPTDNPAVIDYNSLTVISNELGVLVPAYENDFINTLTDIYDCKRYSELRRTTKRSIDIRAPQFNIIAGTTPSYLNNLMPEGAWDQGFISRTMLIYSGRGTAVDLFNEIPLDQKLYADLITDLRQIGGDGFYGKFSFKDTAVDQFRAWIKDAKEEPMPDHPKLQHYNSRRQAHLLKLCMIASASTTDTKIVSEENFVEALDWLLEAEAMMPDIFRSMSSSSAGVMDEAWHFAYTWSLKSKKPIPQNLMVAFVAERAPSHEVLRTLEVMEKAGIMRSQHIQGVGTCYEVQPRRVPLH